MSESSNLWRVFNSPDGFCSCVASVVYALYHIPSFRDVIIRLGAEERNKRSSDKYLTSALGHLFNAIEAGIPAESSDVFAALEKHKHDPKKLLHPRQATKILQDVLSQESQGTHFEGYTKLLFSGEVVVSVERLSDIKKRLRPLKFHELELGVRDMHTLEESFRAYVAPELVENYIDEKGQTYRARCQTTFKHFPPILHVALRRAEYDHRPQRFVQISDTLQYPLTLDVASYFSTHDERSKPHFYDLHAVFVVEKSGSSVHHKVYARISLDRSSWRVFDDGNVRDASEKEVLDQESPSTCSLLYVRRTHPFLPPSFGQGSQLMQYAGPIILIAFVIFINILPYFMNI